MLYAKLNKSGQVDVFPYTVSDLIISRPDVSFPAVMSESDLSGFGLVPVVDTNPPIIDHTQNLRPELNKVNDTWVREWRVEPASPQEVVQRTELQSQAVREDRNARLSATDWRFRSDMNPSQEWKDYCQALRDVPNQAGFPFEIVWPNPSE